MSSSEDRLGNKLSWVGAVILSACYPDIVSVQWRDATDPLVFGCGF